MRNKYLEIGRNHFKLGEELNDLVARISFKGNRAEITDMIFYQGELKFKCQHCASLCCRLGGPPLAQKDINTIMKAGYDPGEFLDSTSSDRFRFSKSMQSVMRNRQDGSCIFLEINKEGSTYECLIYDHRPALCRLYPFQLEVVDRQSFLLRVVPCCRGLNDPEGEPVNEEFIRRHIIKAIIDLLAVPSQ